MTCPTCQHDNPTDNAFCGRCGARLAPACPACGRANLPDDTFCGGCGGRLDAGRAPARDPRVYTPRHLADRILASRSALAGERKQVTVLFADVKGSMELAEQMDPEEWHHILDRFLQLLADGVHRFEGTVNQYTGDGIMALFGAPIAHEDHAQRACWAALHLRDELRRHADELRVDRGLSFSVRMGLNSGDVVVGRIGDDLRMDYTAQGHTVGLAARMEQLAEPGAVFLTEHTARLVSGYFALRDLGLAKVKGASEPLRVHALEGVGRLRTRLDVSRARGFSRFVGRADEMAALEAALARALAGQGQVVGVVADAGVGKSRLCEEFLRQSGGRGLGVHGAHAVAHGKAIPLLPVLELLRNIYGVTEQDSPQAAREKIAGRLLLLDDGLREHLPLVFDFLGVSDPGQPLPHMDPETRQRKLFAVAKRAVQARSRREPAVMFIEDLHWLDAASEAFLEMWVEATGGTRTLLLLNFRPEYRSAWMQRSYYQQLPLHPLGPEATAELLRDLLGPDPALVPLTERIRERTAGNPFFVEEVVQALVEDGTLAGERGALRLVRPIDALAVPASVQAVLAARIDRLPEREKTILQTAAVIGREFGEPVLRRVAALPEGEVAAALRALAAAEFVYETALWPEAEYAFKHPLTQEVAYRSQLADRRRLAHAAAARAIEAIHPTRLDEEAALLAHHWEEAGEALVAAAWHQRAADWVGVRDRGETLRHWRRVQALAASVPESPETLALGVTARDAMMLHGLFVGMSDEEMAELFRDGMELAARLPDPAPRVRLLLRYGVERTLRGELEEARPHLEEALRLAESSGNAMLRFRSLMAMEGLLRNGGNLHQALAIGTECEVVCGGDPEFSAAFTGFSPLGFLLGMRGVVLTHLGRPAEASTALERSLEIARRRGDREVLLMGHVSMALLCVFNGDGERALAHARQAELAAAGGGSSLRTTVMLALGAAHLARGEAREATETLTQGLTTMRAERTGLVLEAWMLAVLGEAQLAAGDPERARETADLTVAAGRRRQTLVYETIAHLAHARVLLATGGLAAAAAIEAALTAAEALVEATDARVHLPFIRIERAKLAGLHADAAARRRHLAEAHRLFAEMGVTARAEEVAREIGT